MKYPQMPTVAEFIEASTVRLGNKLGFKKLGPVLSRERLAFVDMELHNWWSIPPGSRDKKLASTLRLMRWCSDWAQKHMTNEGATRTGAVRMIAVQNLVEQCKLWLGRLYSEAGKLRTLGDDYKSERNAYKNAKNWGQKINPVGGTYIHKMKDDGGDDLKNGPIGQILAKPMAQMTEQDFKTIADATLPQGERHLATTLYMNGEDRQQHILTIRGGLICDADGQAIKKPMVYAMSKYGTLYGFDWKTAYNYDMGGHSTGYFNHSSFMAGKDVICAGTIDKLDWKLHKDNPTLVDKMTITTESGHYKPTAENLKNCLLALRASGLDLKQYAAVAAFPPPGMVALAADFVR